MKGELMFLLGCIPSRLFLAYLAKIADPNRLKVYAALAAVPMLVWVYLYLNPQTRTTGPEVFGGKIWWNDLRMVHALMYLLFVMYALRGKSSSYQVLVADAMIGLVAFLNNRVGFF